MGIILKIDFEMSYGKVNWRLLFECLRMRGYSTKRLAGLNRLGLISKVTKVSSMVTFCPRFFFNFVADYLTKVVNQDQCNGLITGLVTSGPHNSNADDTIICLKHNLDGSRNMKMLLHMFELLAGLKINFKKSDIFMTKEEEWDKKYVDLFNYQVGFS